MCVLCPALFMLRDASFIDDVPEEHRKDFVDSDRIAPYRLKILKKMIQDRFPVCTTVDVVFYFLIGQMSFLTSLPRNQMMFVQVRVCNLNDRQSLVLKHSTLDKSECNFNTIK